MKKKLSSELTQFYKSLWMFFILGLCILLIVGDMHPAGHVAYFISWTIGAFLFWVSFCDLKTVEVDSNSKLPRKLAGTSGLFHTLFFFCSIANILWSMN